MDSPTEQVTELCQLSHVSVYKIRPPHVIREEGEPVIRQRYEVSDWIKDPEDLIFVGKIRLLEIEQLQDFSETTGQEDVDEQLRCTLEILGNDGEVWAHTFYEPLPNVRTITDTQFHTVEKVGGRSFVVTLYWKGYKIAVGIIMKQFWDEISLSHTIQEFKNSKAKLKMFKEKFLINESAKSSDDSESDDDFGDFVSS
ncbi:unnamed protein product [Kuraishia capsulata CBS 1993]|uniref:Uncharacterized protein n=1 Tax=Kuraishia capsulata CBS 1993 TaxID=1382522 RepID=W6MNJ5_9ASCO|nr:uncharacterized protein KUCA_T00004178001 [Kuraishia capsulata CBS 1993]CDK28196.1 unnamed protein product [Kuraishia capsulata CBS 1993]